MSGSVDISSCADCHCGTSSQPKVPVYVNPRIGDFGLVGALEDPEASAPGAIAKAVGTEFYRPARVSSINPKLDVFALGVVLFELLREFRTSE
jgi:translation initiation factor 2-alpha kinase 3